MFARIPALMRSFAAATFCFVVRMSPRRSAVSEQNQAERRNRAGLDVRPLRMPHECRATGSSDMSGVVGVGAGVHISAGFRENSDTNFGHPSKQQCAKAPPKSSTALGSAPASSNSGQTRVLLVDHEVGPPPSALM